MPTTVHLPEDILRSVDRRARDLDMSRNRYIVRALERSLATDTEWGADFVEMLEAARADTRSHELVDEMLRAIVANRTRKGPPAL